MTGDELTAIFGDPVFVRRDPPGKFWRYRSKSCVMELFLYRRDGNWRVDHIDMRQGNASVANQAGCVETLRNPPSNG